MEIILKEDVYGLGYKHDIVTVKNGYGRNYLIPTGKAIIASEGAKKALAEELKQKAKKLAKIKAEAEAQAQKLEGVTVTIVAKVSNQGTIYGSVNSVQVAEELAKQGFEIDRKLIAIKDVKTIGTHKATVRLHKEVSVVITIEVEPDPSTPMPVKEKVAKKEETAETAPAASGIDSLIAELQAANAPEEAEEEAAAPEAAPAE